MLDKSNWPNPHIAVIFRSEANPDRGEDYERMDELIMDLAQQQPGYLGHESVANKGQSIFISYWASRKDIENWAKDPNHIAAKQRAQKWYRFYQSSICEVYHHNEFSSYES